MIDDTTEPVLNASGTHVWLHNPATGGDWECPLEVADQYVEARGWVYMDTAPDTTWDNLVDQTGFNPAEHTVPEVNEHLEKFADSAPGEVNRVLELERAGEDRVTIVDPLDDEQHSGD